MDSVSFAGTAEEKYSDTAAYPYKNSVSTGLPVKLIHARTLKNGYESILGTVFLIWLFQLKISVRLVPGEDQKGMKFLSRFFFVSCKIEIN